MKYILVIGDGMADDPIPELDGKTPLQFAAVPTMDYLADAGVLGSVLTIPDGLEAGSDTAVLSIFGSDPRYYYAGRAPLEAAAMGIQLSPGDIAYRCNMISIEDGDIPYENKKILSHSAGSIEGDISDALVKELCESPSFKEAADKASLKIHPGSSFRHIAVQTLKPPPPSQTQSVKLTPPHNHLGESLGLYLPGGSENADALEELMRIAHEILDSHPINMERRVKGKLPANGIWFWAEGTAIELPNFTEKYGKTGSVISAVPLCQGIGMLMGLEKVYVDGATGELNTNYKGKVDATIAALETRDFATVHIEAPDECTHNGDLKGKLQAIEWIDSKIIAPLVQRLNESGADFRMLVMSDHRTLMSTRGHDGGPVPYVLYDRRTNKKTGQTFCEADSKQGNFLSSGTKLMEKLFEH